MAYLSWAIILLAGLTCTNALGKRISLLERPSTVQVEFRIYNGWSQQCMGNVITSYVMLSAATCFENASYDYRRIRAGTEVRGTGGWVFEINSIRDHPTFGVNSYGADLALIRVQSYFPPGPLITPVAIAYQGHHLIPQQTVDLVGWGSTAEGNLLSNNYLYSLNLVVRSYSDCQRLHGSRVITSNMLCVGLSTYGGRDWDQRDAGAPLFYGNALVGIVSFGVPHGQDASPIVATSIGSYSDWIRLYASGWEIKPDVNLKFGNVVGTFKPVGPDYRQLLFKRLDYLCNKPKKNKIDIALLLLQLQKDKVAFMLCKEFFYMVYRGGAPVEPDLMEDI
ncbi:unnamed protein product [Arctia plantaginis]|uniref:Peptidase S1 domain-containing protein n=1 Tax=Arctia plantaginis TaxID=874455 RepID=A0A8S1A0K6_ARCPL|nr:unnamed protein product [Arctia plantaginis]CAB3238089.1 unnamed protein product [Arctia plantaginis]